MTPNRRSGPRQAAPQAGVAPVAQQKNVHSPRMSAQPAALFKHIAERRVSLRDKRRATPRGLALEIADRQRPDFNAISRHREDVARPRIPSVIQITFS